MITGEKEKLEGIARDYVCSEHKQIVTVAWHENRYTLRCGFEKGHFPEEVTRQPSLTQAYKAGEELSEPILSNVKKGIEKRAAMLPKVPHAETFTGVPAADLGTGELLPLVTLQALVAYAHKYELDPVRGHVCLMYGKPYITIDGYLYHAHQVNDPYKMGSRPLNDTERKQYQVSEGDHAWVCEITKVVTGSQFSGTGIVTAVEMKEESKGKPGQLRSPVVAKHPWQLAQKRAEWQALRRAFPIGETDYEKEK